MPNIASIFKEEISRVARKSVRAETEALKKASTQYRSDIAALKRRLADLERQVKKQARYSKAAPETGAEESQTTGHRFSASGLAKHRQRLGLSAREVGEILGVSALSVYKWEKGQARPRAKQIEAIARLRGMGKREATATLEQLRD